MSRHSLIPPFPKVLLKCFKSVSSLDYLKILCVLCKCHHLRVPVLGEESAYTSMFFLSIHSWPLLKHQAKKTFCPTGAVILTVTHRHHYPQLSIASPRKVGETLRERAHKRLLGNVNGEAVIQQKVLVGANARKTQDHLTKTLYGFRPCSGKNI